MATIESIQQGIFSNYKSMLDTCDVFISKGIDADWWQEMKRDISIKISELAN